MASVLIIEDDIETAEVMAITVKRIGHEAVIAKNLQNGLSQLHAHGFDLVLLDVNLPDGCGLDILPDIHSAISLPEVMIITGEGTFEGAQIAIQNGAWDYLSKPLYPSELMLAIDRVLQYRTEKAKAAPPLAFKREGIIGNSAALKPCFELSAKAAASSGDVMITGETGTGKELFARAIHDNSRRSEKPFVIVDCGALPEKLVESILFGHEKGSFTHAITNRDGLAKQANGGSLFLDEIGELPFMVQSAFLRLLQERKFRPVGGNREIKTDFRLITATNRNLEKMVAENKFRKDLYFRIQSLTINLPPLRKRANDIEELALFYVTKLCNKYGISAKACSQEFIEALKAYHWPGNIRELINVLDRAIPISNEEKTLFPIHLPPHIRISLAHTKFGKKTIKEAAERNFQYVKIKGTKFRSLIKETEKKYFQHLVLETDGDIEKICSISGLSRANVYNRLKKYAIQRNS